MAGKETEYKLVVCMDCQKIIAVGPGSRIKYCRECRGKRIQAGKQARTEKGE